MNSLDKVKKFMSRIDESYGIINESAESDKLENVRDINIERCRRFLVKALENNQFPYFSIRRLSDNPRDYLSGPGGMKAGLDDDGHVFPQWPDCNVGDPATAMYGMLRPVYSQKYKVPSEVNYNPGHGAQRLPNGKYELNGTGHDDWMRAYTPLLNAIINNHSCSVFPKINGVSTYGALGFVLYCLMTDSSIFGSPRATFKLNKIIKYMSKIGLFDNEVEELKNKVVRKGSNMTENGQKIIGSTGPIIGNDGNEILPGDFDIRNAVRNNLEETLGVNRNLIARYRHIEGELSEYVKQQKDTSFEKYSDIRMEPGKVKHTNSGYTILRIDSFDEAKPFRQYTTWCVCTSVGSFDEYGMADGDYSGIPVGGRIYFCLRDDYKNVQKPEVQDGNPLDDYGLSMIAVTVWAEDGSCNTITSRWNHANGGSDDVMSPEELEEILGVSFYDAFPGEQ